MILFVKTVVVWNKGDLNREIARESKKIIPIPLRSCELIVNKLNNTIWENLEFSKGSSQGYCSSDVSESNLNLDNDFNNWKVI